MPIYEYYCSACDKVLTILQKVSEGVKKQCPDCQQDTLTKKVSAPSFQLKGTGWYETDFKTKKTPSGTAKESEKSSTKTTTETKKSTEKATTNTTNNSTTSKQSSSNSNNPQ